ncbi:MAG: hypothetical protein RLZZ450_819 [Pseudomonadota bacterium]|jgi:hypothetical protein
MEELVIVLLKLLVQLVLYAFTGKWHHFGKADDQPASTGTARERPKPARAGSALAGALADLRDPRAAREALRKALAERLRGSPAEAQAPWLFEFPDEYVEAEPSSEGMGGEAPASSPPIFQRPKPATRPPPAPARGGRRRSIASAIRDRQTLRAAIVLGDALAPRSPRR